MAPALWRKTVEALLTVLCPMVLCVGIGAAVRGSAVFAARSGFFQFGVNALIVGVLVLMARRWPTGRYILAGTLITAVLAVMTVRSGPRIVLHTAILIAMWVAAVYVNVKIVGLRRRGRILGPYVVWAFVFAAGLFGAGVVLVILFHPSDVRTSLVFYAELSALTGIGLGMGFKVLDWLAFGFRTGPDDIRDGRKRRNLFAE